MYKAGPKRNRPLQKKVFFFVLLTCWSDLSPSKWFPQLSIHHSQCIFHFFLIYIFSNSTSGIACMFHSKFSRIFPMVWNWWPLRMDFNFGNKQKKKICSSQMWDKLLHALQVCTVMIQHLGFVYTCFWPLSSYCLSQTPHDIQVELFIDCLTVWTNSWWNVLFQSKRTIKKNLQILATPTGLFFFWVDAVPTHCDGCLFVLTS